MPPHPLYSNGPLSDLSPNGIRGVPARVVLAALGVLATALAALVAISFELATVLCAHLCFFLRILSSSIIPYLSILAWRLTP